MKFAPNFLKICKENYREWKILVLVIIFAPFFAYLMYLYLGDSGASRYAVAVLNNDANGQFAAGLVDNWRSVQNDQGESVIELVEISDQQAARKMIRNRSVDLFMTIPEGFSEALSAYQSEGNGLFPELVSYSDQSNLRAMIAMSFIDYISFSYISLVTDTEIPLNVRFVSAGTRKPANDFELMVPALLVLAVIMVFFTAGASIIREVEKETITRLSLSRVSFLDYMTALSANQILIGVASVVLTFLAAASVGYRTEGSLLLLILVAALTSFSVVSIAILTTCFIKNMFGLLTVGCFPFFILMFFSDCFMPLPKIDLMFIFGNQLYINDVLPTATATRVLNKVLTFNSGLGDIQFELIWMLLVSLIYFLVGGLLFKRKFKI